MYVLCVHTYLHIRYKAQTTAPSLVINTLGRVAAQVCASGIRTAHVYVLHMCLSDSPCVCN